MLQALIWLWLLFPCDVITAFCVDVSSRGFSLLSRLLLFAVRYSFYQSGFDFGCGGGCIYGSVRNLSYLTYYISMHKPLADRWWFPKPFIYIHMFSVLRYFQVHIFKIEAYPLSLQIFAPMLSRLAQNFEPFQLTRPLCFSFLVKLLAKFIPRSSTHVSKFITRLEIEYNLISHLLLTTRKDWYTFQHYLKESVIKNKTELKSRICLIQNLETQMYCIKA